MKQKLADFFNLLYGFRNVIIWLILFSVGVFFRIKNYVDGGQWSDLMKNTFLGLVAVHGTEHIVSVVKEYINAANGASPKAATPPPDSQEGNLVEGDEK